jgi:hypothetical protein
MAMMGIGVGTIATVEWWLQRRRELWKIVVAFLLMVANYIAGATILIWDPFRVLYWHMD